MSGKGSRKQFGMNTKKKQKGQSESLRSNVRDSALSKIEKRWYGEGQRSGRK